jgi:tetratricopeptide (TPR) repeat protein
MTEHLLPADLDRLAEGRLSARERQRLVAHLLRRCPECVAVIAGSGAVGPPAGDGRGEDYDLALDRAFDAALRLTAPRREAMDTVAALLAGGRGAGRLSATQLAELRELPRLQALLESAAAFRHEDPQAMLRFAKLARHAADRLRMREYGRQPVADLRALAWAELASAFRVCNQLGLADSAINRAIYWCRRGSRSEMLLARVADLLASLLAYQRRFPEGLELLACVCRIHAEAGDRHLAGRALLSQANLTFWSGDPRRALSLLLRGFKLLDPAREPQLPVQAVWNMIWFLSDLGHFRAARRLLWRSRAVVASVIEPHRLRWFDGRIYAGLSDFPRAEAALRQARAGFTENGQPYPAALAGLDLATVLARQGRYRELFDLAQEMIVTFRSLRIAREGVAALLVLQKACMHSKRQLLGVIEIAQSMLRDLERQPARPRDYSGSPPSPSSPSSSS